MKFLCNKCLILKAFSCFSINKTKRLGINSICKSCHSEYRKQKYSETAECSRKYSSQWKKDNKGYTNFINSKRRAAKLNATPKWLSKDQLAETKKIYENCPEGYEVDHIIPLLGKEVRGLHVPWNLQYLTPYENLSKKNKVL